MPNVQAKLRGLWKFNRAADSFSLLLRVRRPIKNFYDIINDRFIHIRQPFAGIHFQSLSTLGIIGKIVEKRIHAIFKHLYEFVYIQDDIIFFYG